MPYESAEQTFPSTTWAWKRVKIACPPEAMSSAGARLRRAQARPRFYGLPPWPIRRRPLALTVKYRGGAQAWVEVHSRGRTIRVPGDTTIYDLVREMAQAE
jgi:hypothetical protein